MSSEVVEMQKLSSSWQTCAVRDAAPCGAVRKPPEQESQKTWKTCAAVEWNSWKDPLQRSKTSDDCVRTREGETGPDGKAGGAAEREELYVVMFGAVEPKPVKWSRDTVANSGKEIEVCVGSVVVWGGLCDGKYVKVKEEGGR